MTMTREPRIDFITSLSLILSIFVAIVSMLAYNAVANVEELREKELHDGVSSGGADFIRFESGIATTSPRTRQTQKQMIQDAIQEIRKSQSL